MKSHETPLQVAAPLGGGVHGVQALAPHEFTEVFATHWLPHLWKPWLQTKSHCWLAQMATEFAGGVQGVQLVPQVAVSLLLAHMSPQR